MKQSKTAAFLVCLLLAVTLVLLPGCTSKTQPTASSEKPMVLKLGHVAAIDVPYDLGAKGFAADVEKATNGKIKIEVYPSAQLGDERGMFEQVQIGSLDMVVASTGVAANFAKELTVLEFPFLFRDAEHAQKVLDGEVGDYLSEKLYEAGFKNLGFWEFGIKNISNNQRPIRTVSDMKGLKMRVLENPLLTATYRALGADPTPIPLPEVYTSLQQGVADGFEGPYINFTDQRLYEVQDYLSELNISYGATILAINRAKFESFDPEVQKIFEELGEKWTKEERRLNAETIKEFKQICLDEGVNIIENADLDIESFKKAVEPVYEQFSEYADLVEKIRSVK